MANVAPQMEISDQLGSQTWYSSTVGTTSIALPGSAGNNIISAQVRNPTSNPNNRVLSYSVDDLVFHTLNVGEVVSFKCRGGQKQIWIKASAASTNYEVKISFDQAGESA